MKWNPSNQDPLKHGHLNTVFTFKGVLIGGYSVHTIHGEVYSTCICTCIEYATF